MQSKIPRGGPVHRDQAASSTVEVDAVTGTSTTRRTSPRKRHPGFTTIEHDDDGTVSEISSSGGSNVTHATVSGAGAPLQKKPRMIEHPNNPKSSGALANSSRHITFSTRESTARNEVPSSSDNFLENLRSSLTDPSSVPNSRSSTPKRIRRGVTESPPSKKCKSTRNETERSKSVSPRLIELKKSVNLSQERSETSSAVMIYEESQSSCFYETPVDSDSESDGDSSKLSSCYDSCASELPLSTKDNSEESREIELTNDPNASWLLILVISTSLGKELEKAIRSANPEKRTITQLFLKNIEESFDFLTESKLDLENLEFFGGQVEESGSENGGTVLLKNISSKSPLNKKEVWRLLLVGKISPCFRYHVTVGNVLLLYGCSINRTNKTIKIDSEKLSKNCFIFHHCIGKKRPEHEIYGLTRYSVYASTNTWVHSDDRPTCSIMVLGPRSAWKSKNSTEVGSHERENENNPSSGNRLGDELDKVNSIDVRMSTEESFPIGDDGSEVLPENSRTSRVGNVNRNEGVIPSPDIHANISFRRKVSATELSNDDDVQTDKSPPTVMGRDIEEMTYDDWVASGCFVPGDQRPKARKARWGEAYNYKSLKILDDELNLHIKSEARKAKTPSMILPKQQFAYGIVDEILPPHLGYVHSYLVKISDETMKNVLLRLCTSEMSPILGPEIKVGQVIRAHRITVQVERDPVLKRQKMVLSTAPHLNYTLFYFEDTLRKNNIVFDTIAKTISLTDDDEKRVFDLLTFQDERAQLLVDSESQEMAEDWNRHSEASNGTVEIGIASNKKNERLLSEQIADNIDASGNVGTVGQNQEDEEASHCSNDNSREHEISIAPKSTSRSRCSPVYHQFR